MAKFRSTESLLRELAQAKKKLQPIRKKLNKLEGAAHVLRLESATLTSQIRNIEESLGRDQESVVRALKKVKGWEVPDPGRLIQMSLPAKNAPAFLRRSGHGQAYLRTPREDGTGTLVCTVDVNWYTGERYTDGKKKLTTKWLTIRVDVPLNRQVIKCMRGTGLGELAAIAIEIEKRRILLSKENSIADM